MKIIGTNKERIPLLKVVDELKITTQNSSTKGLKKYIGFEHIESENLKVNSFGNVEDGISFKKTFRKNDVLFGKIRAYLKKVAVAPFDGLCSGDILVLRTKNEMTLKQDLLPYILSTNSFYQIAIDTSIGTTMPRTKWQYISLHEFPLPSIQDQTQLIKLFQCLDFLIEQSHHQEQNFKMMLITLINDFISEKSKFRKSCLKKISFGEIAENISEHIDPNKAKDQIFVGLDHLDSGEIVISRFGKPDNLIGIKLRVYKGDIIFGKRNAYLRKAAIANFDGICSAHAMVIRAKNTIIKDFLPYFMHSDSFMNRAKEISEGSISPTIKWKNLERQEFQIPDLKTQEKLLLVLQQIELIRSKLKTQKQALKNLKQKLLNEILG